MLRIFGAVTTHSNSFGCSMSGVLGTHVRAPSTQRSTWPGCIYPRGVYKPSIDLQSCPSCQLSTMISSAGESLAQKGAPGNISSVFDRKVQGDPHPRFSELKKTIWKESMKQSWTQVLDALKEKAEQIGSVGSKAGNSTRDPFFALKLPYHRRSQELTTTSCRKDYPMNGSRKSKKRAL